jgi:HEAT repeat protein
VGEVYKKLPLELKDALKAFEIGALDRIIDRKRKEDFKALRVLLNKDADVNPDDRQRAIYALGRWGDPSVVPEIVSLLSTLKESHRITAIEALGRLGTNPARRAVESYADDPSPQVRKFVVEALSRIGDRAAKAALQKIAREDREPWIRDFAAKRMKIRAPGAAKKR